MKELATTGHLQLGIKGNTIAVEERCKKKSKCSRLEKNRQVISFEKGEGCFKMRNHPFKPPPALLLLGIFPS
jgi:hypothetical protein